MHYINVVVHKYLVTLILYRIYSNIFEPSLKIFLSLCIFFTDIQILELIIKITSDIDNYE